MPLFLFAVPALILFLNSSVHLQTVKHVSQEDSALTENHTDLFGGNDLHCLLKVSLSLKIRVKYISREGSALQTQHANFFCGNDLHGLLSR